MKKKIPTPKAKSQSTTNVLRVPNGIGFQPPNVLIKK